MKLHHDRIALATLGATLALLVGCAAGSSPNLPLVTPPVLAATPAALRGSAYGSALTMPGAVDIVSAFKSRFFSPSPTSVFDTLQAIDERLAELNSRTTTSGCLTQGPVEYELTPWGQSVPFYAQCAISAAPSTSGAANFLQWAQVGEDTYLYTAFGQEHVAVIATAVTGGYRIHAWIGIGYENASCNASSSTGTWDGCSYGVLELLADEGTRDIEVAVAGIGFGYCGAQLRTDGTSVYGIGSGDMATQCDAPESLCVAASDLTSAGACDAGADVVSFELTPVGRVSAPASNVAPLYVSEWASSEYPSTGATVLLDGSSTDALGFGPAAPTEGVGSF